MNDGLRPSLLTGSHTVEMAQIIPLEGTEFLGSNPTPHWQQWAHKQGYHSQLSWFLSFFLF